MYFYEGKKLIVCDESIEGKEIAVNYDFNEKHTRSFEVIDNEIKVTIDHGMSEEHYITTIVYQHENGYDVVRLSPNDKASWTFEYKGNGIIFEYCNLHGVFAVKI